MLEKIKKLIDVKSILTLLLTCVFANLCLRTVIAPEVFVDIYKLIIIFYFGAQSVKNAQNKTEEKKEE